MKDIKFLIKLYLIHLGARILWIRDKVFLSKNHKHEINNFSNQLYSHYENVAQNTSYKEKLLKKEYKVFSQNGEDGLLLYIFSQIGTTNRTLVEFGIESGHECNAANLIINFGWNGLLMDGGKENIKNALKYYHNTDGCSERIKIEQSFVTAENINETFISNAIEGEIDLLSIDIDGNDYWVWQAIQVINPRVVVIEFNASFGSEKSITVKYDPEFRRFKKHKSGWYHGASLSALTKLAKEKNYKLVGTDSFGCNAFFLRNDIATGDLQEITPLEAFYPQPKRCLIAEKEEQFNFIKHLEYVEI